MMAGMLLFVPQHKGTFTLYDGDSGKFISFCVQKLVTNVTR